MLVRHHIRVFVVDDWPEQAELIGSLLEECGYQTRVFTDPREIIAAAAERPCDIAVVNLRMPFMDGIEVVERLRAIDPKMRTIIDTCDPALDGAIAAMKIGVNDYLVLPFRPAELLDCVEWHCRKLGLLCTSPAEANQLIGKRIRTERLRQALTLRQVSQRADLTTSQLSQVELGKNAISLWGLARIANSLGLRLPALLSGL